MSEEMKLSGFSQFIFYKLDQSYHRLDEKTREAGVRQFTETAEKSGSGIETKFYSSVGLRADVDFFVWNRAAQVEDLEKLAVTLRHTALGRYLHTPYLYVSLYRESPYPKLKDHEPPKLDNPQYIFVYPFVKMRSWYHLPLEERGKAMREHIAVGHKFERVKVNTSYCFGLGDHEFIIAFESSYPGDFEALVRRLRDSEASRYTQIETPIFMGHIGTATEILRTCV
ncbi:MAG: chlorite dismutase family protein [Candidatus Wallbacteria bacterium]|nr:chlorite dismutase family protein [Candidatus Wallbacteria bacterium]